MNGKQMDHEELLQVAQDVVGRASAIALSPPPDLVIETKNGRNDLVTQVDRLIEDAVAAELRESTGIPLIGEEGHRVESFAGRVWVLDPIDGTTNYIETGKDYAISLALCEDGIPVVALVCDVTRNLTYTAIRNEGAQCNGVPLNKVDQSKPLAESIILTDLKEIEALPRLVECLLRSRGHRRYGSAALECVEVAASRAGAFVHLWVSPWDIAAAILICEEAGATVSRLDGTPLDVRYKGSIVVGAPKVHEELIHALVMKGIGIG